MISTQFYKKVKIISIFVYFYLIFSVLFRIILWFLFSESKSIVIFFKTLFFGFVSDISAALLIFFIPFIFLNFFFQRIISKKKISHFLHLLFIFIYPAVQIFLFFTEYFFFEEFNSRFNAVAVDYLIYPTEVFVNIWQSYNVLSIIFICLIFGLPFSIFIYRKIKKFEYSEPNNKFKDNLFFVLIYVFILFISYIISPFKGISFSDNRIINEIGKNGINSFIYAAYSHSLDYYHFYKTIEKDEAHIIARKLLEQDNIQFTNNEKIIIERNIIANGKMKKLNVIYFIVESFGSEFWGVLGRKESLTPYMDKLSNEGILFSNIYSIGNRTVRGLEGVLSGVPPLPSESIVKLKFSDTTKTIAQIFKEYGYKTIFIYGGRGIFDNMKPFAMRYGFDSFIEQKDFKNPRFKTIWGVCDQDIYKMALNKFSELDNNGDRFFSVVLSVSNHKPYTYPTGAISENPLEKKRKNAVKYTDYALGEFFEKAKKMPFYKNTLFVIIADHGARVYGKQEIPIKSYEIPLLIIGPGIKHAVNKTLGSSIDVSPTVLDILNFNYKSSFWGRSLLDNKIKYRWLPINHNRNVGFFDGNKMVVLDLNKISYFYLFNNGNLEKINNTNNDEIEKKAISVFQTAWDIYQNGLK